MKQDRTSGPMHEAAGSRGPDGKVHPGGPAGAALAALASGQLEQARALAHTAVQHEPQSVAALQALAVVLAQTGEVLPALQRYEQALLYAPDDAQLHFNHAVMLGQHGLDALAMTQYARCLELDPRHGDALWNCGELLRMREHFDRALACFGRLLAMEGGMRPKMGHRMAVCCAHLGQDARARALFEQQIALDDHPVTRWEYALFLLGQGEYGAAWPHHAYRFSAVVRREELPYPLWQGQYVRDAVLVVCGEQGAGDEILFSTFLAPLLERTRAQGMQVVLACRPTLQRLLRASFGMNADKDSGTGDNATSAGGTIERGAGGLEVPVRTADLRADMAGAVSRCVAARGDSHAAAPPVWWISIGDLPQWVEQPSPCAWLVPDEADVRLMRSVLGSGRDPGNGTGRTFRIGLAWRSSPWVKAANRVDRSVPTGVMAAWLEGLAQRLGAETGQKGEQAGQATARVQFYSLHHAEHRAHTQALAGLGVKDMGEWLTDLSRTAALMNELDVVVSVCTSTANLAGALGCDTRVLLRRHADWRWGKGAGTEPDTGTEKENRWYGYVKPYRQSVWGDWTEPLRQLSDDLVKAVSRTNGNGE